MSQSVPKPTFHPEVLPDEPDTFGVEAGGFRQQWRPGAFGDRQTIKGVFRFRVLRDEWHEDDDGSIWRTIHEAEVAGAEVREQRLPDGTVHRTIIEHGTIAPENERRAM